MAHLVYWGALSRNSPKTISGYMQGVLVWKNISYLPQKQSYPIVFGFLFLRTIKIRMMPVWPYFRPYFLVFGGLRFTTYLIVSQDHQKPKRDPMHSCRVMNDVMCNRIFNYGSGSLTFWVQWSNFTCYTFSKNIYNSLLFCNLSFKT